MVKYSITKEEYEALSPELKAEYKESGDAYKLDVSGIDAKAQDKLEGERSRRRDAEKKASDAEKALEDFKDGDDRPAIVAKAARDVAKEKERADKAEAKFASKLRTDTLGNTANTLATSLSAVNAKVLLPHINARLDVDMTDAENPKVVVLGADGKPSALTVDQLKAEFVANKDFAGIITGSHATGGAASKGGNTGRSGLPSAPGTPPTPGARAPVNLAKLSAPELAAEMTARRAARGLEVVEVAK